MKTQSSLRAAGGLLIAAGLLTGICFELLRQHFQYPDILRMPTGYVLRQYQAAGAGLQVLWYGMTLGALLLIPASLLLHQGLSDRRVGHATLITGLGVGAGLFNTLGFIRWVFMVPALAATYTHPASGPATREAARVVFEAFHLYLGFSVGEHLGFLFLAGWSGTLAFALRALPAIPRWFSAVGLLAAAGTLAGTLEGAGWSGATGVVAVSSSVLLLWMVGLGVFLLAAGGHRPGVPARKTLAALALVAVASAAQAQSGGVAAAPPATRQALAGREISINGFRNPSVGVEYRRNQFSVHAGYYPTILRDQARTESGAGNNTTSFVRAGVSYWFLPHYSRRSNLPSAGYASLSYVRGLDYEYRGKNGVMGEMGFRWVVWKGLQLRLGAAVLKAPGTRWQFNPTPGISYGIALR